MSLYHSKPPEYFKDENLMPNATRGLEKLGGIIEQYREAGFVPDQHGQPVSPSAFHSVSRAVVGASEAGHPSSHSPVSQQPSKQYTPSGSFEWDKHEPWIVGAVLWTVAAAATAGAAMIISVIVG